MSLEKCHEHHEGLSIELSAVIPTPGGQQHLQRSATKHNKKINAITRTLVSGQLKFSFYTSKLTMAVISLSSAIAATALTLILRKKNPP